MLLLFSWSLLPVFGLGSLDLGFYHKFSWEIEHFAYKIRDWLDLYWFCVDYLSDTRFTSHHFPPTVGIHLFYLQKNTTQESKMSFYLFTLPSSLPLGATPPINKLLEFFTRSNKSKLYVPSRIGPPRAPLFTRAVRSSGSKSTGLSFDSCLRLEFEINSWAHQNLHDSTSMSVRLIRSLSIPNNPLHVIPAVVPPCMSIPYNPVHVIPVVVPPCN